MAQDWHWRDLRHLSERIEGDGSKMGHIKLRGVEDIDTLRFESVARAAVTLNRTLGNPARWR